MADKKTILIVEDETAMLQALGDKFTKAGYNVLTACDGVEGLELALDKKPDLIMLDVIMPKMDGMTFLKKITVRSEILLLKLLVFFLGDS